MLQTQFLKFSLAIFLLAVVQLYKLQVKNNTWFTNTKQITLSTLKHKIW